MLPPEDDRAVLTAASSPPVPPWLMEYRLTLLRGRI